MTAIVFVGMSMKVIVTGASGFIGRHLMKALKNQGYKVLGINTRASKDTVVCDITSPELIKYIDKGDKIVHLAAIAEFNACKDIPTLALRVNVEGTMNIIQACLEKKADRIIFTSSGAVYSKRSLMMLRQSGLVNEYVATDVPPSFYGLTKRFGEELFSNSQVPYIILRLGFIYGRTKDWGAIGNWVRLLREGKQPVINWGKQKIDFVYIKDVVDVIIAALETKTLNEVFNIGSGKGLEVRKVYQIVKKEMGSTVKAKIKPLRSFDIPRDFIYDISKAMLFLRWKPKWSLRKGIKDMLKDDGD